MDSRDELQQPGVHSDLPTGDAWQVGGPWRPFVLQGECIPIPGQAEYCMMLQPCAGSHCLAV